MKVKSIDIADIKIGTRRREDYGDINGLAESIGKYGLLHPITVDGENYLVAGGRRVRACRQLGWSEMPARFYSELSEDERREIELEENVRRKDLSAYERSKNLTQLAETAAQVLKTDFQADAAKNSGRGRPQKPDAEAKIAERIGVPQRTINDARQHVAAVESYPELASPGIPQKDAIEIAKNLNALPEGERAEARSRIIAGDTNTKAVLAGKPPVPPPLPKPKTSAAQNWQANIVKMRQGFSAIKDNGGIVRVVAEWEDEDKATFLSELEGLRSELNNMITELEAETYAVR